MAPLSRSGGTVVVVVAFVVAAQLAVSNAFAPQAYSVARQSVSSSDKEQAAFIDGRLAARGSQEDGGQARHRGCSQFRLRCHRQYTCSVPGAAQPFARSNSQKVIVGDGIMIRGWDTALQTMTVGEKATVVVTDAERFGYGAEGIPPFVPPNSQLEMEIELLGAEDGADLSSLATSDPLKPVRGVHYNSG